MYHRQLSTPGIYQTHVSRESIEEEPKGKAESESENDGSSINKSHIKMNRKEKKKTCLSQKSKQKKKQVLERTFDHLSKTLGNLTDAIKNDFL